MTARLQFDVASRADFAALRDRFKAIPMRPKIMASRDAGVDISSPGRQSLTLLVGEETGGRLYSGDVYLMPGFGAPPHHQPTEEELWYLLEGELDVRVGHRRTTLGPGAFAYIPRDTTHAFRNNGTAPVRLLTWNSPAGHERAFEAMRAMAARGITAFPELRDMFLVHEVVMHADEQEATDQDAAPGPKIASRRSEGKDVSWPGADARQLLDGSESRGEFDVLDLCLRRDSGLPLHLHRQTDKCIYVLDGHADLKVGPEVRRVGRGAFALVPRGVPMSFTDAGGDPVRLLLWSTPAQPVGAHPWQSDDCVLVRSAEARED